MDVYIKFIENIIDKIPQMSISSNIVSVYLGGSVARGDYVVGISDIDIYIVIKQKDEATEEQLNINIQEIANKQLSELLSWCPDSATVAFTTVESIKNGTSWLGTSSDYYSFIENGKLIYGDDIKQYLVEPSKDFIMATSQQFLTQLKGIVNGELPQNIVDKYFVRSIFGTFYSAIHFKLCTEGIYIRGKGSLTEMFCKNHRNYSLQAKKIYDLWYVFAKRSLTTIEINNLIKLTKEIVINL